MGHRRSSESTERDRRWRAFVVAQASLVRAAGLPEAVMASQARWDDFLMHGYLDHHDDPGGFSVAELNGPAYGALRELVGAYFATGGGFFTPFALRPEDQAALRARFAASE